MSTKSPRIAVIGGGSFATALIKLLANNNEYVGWWVRDPEMALHIQRFHHNPRYLTDVALNTEHLAIDSDLDSVVEDADIIVLAVPSAFLKSALENLHVSLEGKKVFSAIKGIVPDSNQIVGEFMHDTYGVDYKDFGVIVGPCHAEEVALERLSYLTLASESAEAARYMADMLACTYLRTQVSDDIYGTEYAAVLKNIYSIACGICHGLGYGDNFQAVLVSNSVQEMKRFIKAVHPIKRDINGSEYLGDLLVTAYSQFSRNRTFGTMIGKGYTVRSTMLEMNMVAEGYYATKLIKSVKKSHDVRMPIANAVYKILYDGESARKTMAKLAEKLA
ncbi:MAG: NAD(P)H-dependent glycerol-3-phosphate dehydrogenase [Schleiferiaceae bacterium]|nr:NAD(P)H-dependent glycerol-3-phosphate dehydrogenase [Schleiferiaceae bacterium]MDP4627235.1 NAD(P)H-dependent glycerol-3-phosphate dehydrogenase [Schleiferiaceae bacterium]MDP4727911.1 NAD(P)H-dependent glycerol-3-phosphate dehydrogenase [Schleiferiaceae bacterium]MDP4749070.1 NAD(P)H-dependent glycerol-3-phosphate dehydrogenase [Schleiferiaceae bacterium]MDP4859374.1 NAD(P)H-dependent glycerol-3-phosphate dehydrogenase [Schleiferiaceae bacterium]